MKKFILNIHLFNEQNNHLEIMKLKKTKIFMFVLYFYNNKLPDNSNKNVMILYLYTYKQLNMNRTFLNLLLFIINFSIQ